MHVFLQPDLIQHNQYGIVPVSLVLPRCLTSSTSSFFFNLLFNNSLQQITNKYIYLKVREEHEQIYFI